MSDLDTSSAQDFFENLIPDEKVREKIKNFDEETIMELFGQQQVKFGEDAQAVTFHINLIPGWTSIKILEAIRRHFGFQLSNIEIRSGLEALALIQPFSYSRYSIC